MAAPSSEGRSGAARGHVAAQDSPRKDGFWRERLPWRCPVAISFGYLCKDCSSSLRSFGSADRVSVIEEDFLMHPDVIVIDDDPWIRDSLESLLQSVGLSVKTLASVPEFVKLGRPDSPTCLVLDVRLPGQSGLDFQKELASANIRIPIVFLTGHADIQMSVRAMKSGAIEFLEKPARDQELLDAIRLALAQDSSLLEHEKNLADLRGRYQSLSKREREVMGLVVKGRLNRQIAAEMGLSEITVKIHRGHVMRKMQASSLPDLARMADKLGSADAA